VKRFLPTTRKLAAAPVAVAFVLLAAAFTSAGLAGSPSTHVSRSVDTGLCPFPLAVTVTGKDEAGQVGTTALRFSFAGPSTIRLHNASTGRTAILDSSGSTSVDTRTGSVTFRGHQVWFWSTGKHVPFVSTDGKGSLDAPYFVLSSATSHARVIDPCALLAAAPPSTKPVTTPAPWGLPASALSQIDYAGLTPLLGVLIRHDHVHLDVVVNGKKVTVPAGIGLAEPVDGGPCPAGPIPQGDCATGHVFVAQVANSPLHTHSASGIIHVEPDRRGTFTLGEFFDEWGVRFNSSCLGGYCTGRGMALRVFVDGKRVSSNPRSIVLTNRQEITVVFGAPGDFGSVPATYSRGWPGLGCGGPRERSCSP
jgi:hypothetical protein